MCILSLDSSTLPSASMTPGKVSREADRAGALTAATLLRERTSACCRLMLPGSSPTDCSGFPLKYKMPMHVCRFCDHTQKFAVFQGTPLTSMFLSVTRCEFGQASPPPIGSRYGSQKWLNSAQGVIFQFCFPHIHPTGNHMTVPLKFSSHSRWSPSLWSEVH